MKTMGPTLAVMFYLRKRPTGRLSPCLWGPELGFRVKTPPSLPSIQELGAASRFRCFLGPRGMVVGYFWKETQSRDHLEFTLKIQLGFRELNTFKDVFTQRFPV